MSDHFPFFLWVMAVVEPAINLPGKTSSGVLQSFLDEMQLVFILAPIQLECLVITSNPF